MYTPAQGITQIPGLSPKKVIKIFGQEYVLAKSAFDSSVSFPHERVKVQDGDCIKLEIDGKLVYFCYLHGVISPLPNSLERPLNVYYAGFNRKPVDIRFISPSDISRMHVYKCDTTNWAETFAKTLLQMDVEQEREPMQPWIPDMLEKQPQVQQTPQPQQQVQQPISQETQQQVNQNLNVQFGV